MMEVATDANNNKDYAGSCFSFLSRLYLCEKSAFIPFMQNGIKFYIFNEKRDLRREPKNWDATWVTDE